MDETTPNHRKALISLARQRSRQKNRQREVRDKIAVVVREAAAEKTLSISEMARILTLNRSSIYAFLKEDEGNSD